MEHYHPLAFGTVSVVQKGGSLQITIPVEVAKLMDLKVNDLVRISFDPFTKEMTVSKESTRVVSRREAEILYLLQSAQTYLPRGHYILNSNRHSRDYVQIRLALAQEQYAKSIGQAVVELLQGQRIDAVAFFSVGGFRLATVVSAKLKAKLIVGEKMGRKNKTIEVVFYNLNELEKNDRILLVDDVLTTGESLRAAIHVFEKEGRGIVTAAVVVVDRSQGEHVDLNISLLSLASISLREYEANSCPMCKEGLPSVNLSRADTEETATINSLPESQRTLMAKAYRDFREIIATTKHKKAQDMEVPQN
jgi:orotate phosphoribosyltransferase